MAVRAEPHAEPIPGYRLIERLGGGGFGEVWRAEAPGGMHKAIKFVFGDLSSGGDSDQRAKQELKALERVRSVRHPYILSLERYEVIDGQLLIVMELADRNLWDRFKECRSRGLPGIPREELLHYMREAAEALDLMNQEYQLQHLDIKPQNIFLVSGHIKVADFGLVKDLEGSQASVTGGITPVYAAPETFDGKVTRFSDQYSLAILYQELLTGLRPFNGVNVRQLILQHISAPPNVTPLPENDRPAIARSLAKTPDERFPSCRDLVHALTASGRPGGDAPTAPVAAQSLPPDWQGGPPASLATGVLSAGLVTANIRLPLPDVASHQGTTESLRPAEPVMLQPVEVARRVAPAEVAGSGSLFPTLVIGLGQVGLTVLQQLRETLHTRVAPLKDLGQIRFLHIDTDSEVMRTATRGSPAGRLTSAEMLLMPLNRPSYYLKPREGRASFTAWLNPRMLYRIPRSQVTTGVRALGRLAFCDNFRILVRRLQMELESALDPEALASAARLTRLGVRSNRPRVYLATSVAGGTGSGMFLDLAYTLRALLRQMGYDIPDVVGLLFLPPVDSSRSRVMALGNAYAALTELNYFGSPGTTFHGKYHDREAPFSDDGPPFSRNLMLPLPEESDEVATREVIDLAAQFLYRDMATPFGKVADLARADILAPAWERRGQYFQTFNLFQLSWPRHSLLSSLSRHLCQRIVNRWASKDSKPIRDLVQHRIQERWHQQGLSSDQFIQRLQDNVIGALGKDPETLFAEVAGLLPAPSAQGATARGGVDPRPLEPEQVAAALEQLLALVGGPGEVMGETHPLVVGLVQDQGDVLAKEWSQKLAELSVELIEDPAFRLAGAEEAIRQMVVSLEQALQQYEPLSKDLAERVDTTYERLQALAGSDRSARKAPGPTRVQVKEWIRQYGKWRLQSLILHHVTSTLVALRGHLSDELREVNFCRVRLAELNRAFEESLPGELPPSGSGGPRRHDESHIGERLLPAGCQTLDGVVALVLADFTPERLLELDGRMEEMLKASYNALVHVCLSNANILKPVQSAMLGVARAFAEELLPPASVVELFFEKCPDQGLARAELAAHYDEAAPEISNLRSKHGGPGVVELCVLATPQEPRSAELREAFQQAVPDVEVVYADSAEDILIYRERTNLVLTDLEPLGPVGHEAYLKLNASDDFTPHARCDIDFQPP